MGFFDSIGDALSDVGDFVMDRYDYVLDLFDFGGPEVDVEQHQLLTGPQQQLLNAMMANIGTQIGQPGPYATPQGQQLLGPSPLQTQAFGYAGQLPGQIQSLFSPFLNQSPQDLFDPISAYTSRVFERDIVPQITGRFGNLDAADSSVLQRELSRAGSDLALGMGAQFAPLALQQQGLNLQGSLGAANAYSQIPGLLSGLGGAQRGLGMEQFEQAQAYMNPYLRYLPAVLPYGQPVLENIAIGQPAGLGRELLAGGIQGLSTAVGMGALSDNRAKEHVEAIPTAIDKCRKLKAFTYNYKGGPVDQRRCGLMAQDVERVMPEAVIERDGVKYVDTYAIQSLIVQAIGEIADGNVHSSAG